MEKCPWAIGSACALTSPDAEITGGGGMNGVYACVCVIVCSGQCRSLSSDKQVLCHMVKMTRKDMRDSLLVVKHNLFFAFHKKVQNK